MTGEEYYNLKQGDKVIVTKSTPTFLGIIGTIYEMVYRDHFKEGIYLQCISTASDEVEVGCIKIVDPAMAFQFLNVYNDNMEKKELKIPVDFNVGDEFWIMKDNKHIVKKLERIDIKVDKYGMYIFYENGIASYTAYKMYHTKQELINSL